MQKNYRRNITVVRIVIILCGIALGYIAILFGVRMIGDRLEGTSGQEPVGSLEGRFQRITMEHGDNIWEYREHDLTNILLLGTDWEADEGARTGRYAGQADFLLLITLDRKTKSMTALQLDRDTITDIRIYGPFGDYTGIRKTQLCLAYAYGSSTAQNCENEIWAVSRLLGGIPIDAYMTLDISGIALLNDALGGITVTLEEDFTALDSTMTPGTTLTLHGKQAEYYARSRMSIGDGTNTARMRRQRAFIAGVQEKLISGMNSDVNYISRVLDDLVGHLVMSKERSWFINKAYEAREYDYVSDIHTLTGTHTEGLDGYIEFHPDVNALSDYLTQYYFEKS